MASTPAIKVVATAPMPGMRTPSLPLGVDILVPFLITSNPFRKVGNETEQWESQKNKRESCNEPAAFAT
jgi:hypothetical protein